MLCINMYNAYIKGIVHPKMKIRSSFTHPQVVPNLYECICSAEHKGRYSEECEKQNSSGAPLTSIGFVFPTMEVNGAPKQPGYKLYSKYLKIYKQYAYILALEHTDQVGSMKMKKGQGFFL